MRGVVMGTPANPFPSLRKHASPHEVALVLTRPDAVRSRGKKLEPSPVKEAALELDLPAGAHASGRRALERQEARAVT